MSYRDFEVNLFFGIDIGVVGFFDPSTPETIFANRNVIRNKMRIDIPSCDFPGPLNSNIIEVDMLG